MLGLPSEPRVDKDVAWKDLPDDADEPDLLYTDVEEDAARQRARPARRPLPAATGAAPASRRHARTTPSCGRRSPADIGLAGLLVPEELGGARRGPRGRRGAGGAGPRGRARAVPHQRGRRHPRCSAARRRDRRLLGRLAAGERTAALAVAVLATVSARGHVASSGRRRRALTGTVTSVAGALERRRLLVVPAAGRTPPSYARDRPPGATRRAGASSLDMTRPLADLDLSESRRPGSQRRMRRTPSPARCGRGRAARLRAARRRRVVPGRRRSPTSRSATSSAGRSGRSRRSSTGWPTCGVEVELRPRAAARYAAAALGRAATPTPRSRRPRWRRRTAAASRCSAAEECVQLHGGIGMTWEHPAHLYLKRAKADQIALGTPAAPPRLARRTRRPAGVLVGASATWPLHDGTAHQLRRGIIRRRGPTTSADIPKSTGWVGSPWLRRGRSC